MAANWKKPSAFVFADRENCVSLFFIVMLTSGTTAPFESVTVPCRVPIDVSARPNTEWEAANDVSNRASKIRIDWNIPLNLAKNGMATSLSGRVRPGGKALRKQFTVKSYQFPTRGRTLRIINSCSKFVETILTGMLGEIKVFTI